MVKAFFMLVLLGLGLLAWIAVPQYVRRPCPVCQGAGVYSPGQPIEVLEHGQLLQRQSLLCPFCEGGTVSLFELRERRTKMLQWMVKEQKLPPEVLVKRVKDAFGQAGLDELHNNNFFMQGGSADAISK